VCAVKLIEIKGKYDMIFSLGNQCAVANKLRHYRLRPYAGVIDWMISFSLPGVTDLLRNRFVDFMKKDNLVFDGYHAAGTKLILKDTRYDISSAHDFSTTENTVMNWATYPKVKAKFDRRVQRFLKNIEEYERLLFIRILGTYDETKELEIVLSSLVKHNFTILMLNPIAEHTIIEYDWDIPNVCSIGIPMGEEYPEIWDILMGGIMCKARPINEELV
jgi:hypothetical protein